ncbi:MAG: Unknown protein [uncultured Thiotrichaceae bacterium]|uniref:Uncharacterized protein n=1 Tax=uncultured Thiotrichaceae bacterium TaxID=298394 RepID=A0A6S6UHB0_9GAMM|nr:MAG: Unknown protein [uncultured Thiotrichaceae bacterium]
MKRYTLLFWLFLVSLPASAEKPKKLSLVTTEQVISKPLQEVLPLSGTTEALRESGLSPRIDGLVAKLHVQEGDWITAGQPLLELDSAIAKTQVASAQARLEEAQTRYKEAQRQRKEFQTLRKQLHATSNTVESAIADENAAKATVAAQRADLQRLQVLFSRHTLKAPFSGLIAEKHTEVGQWVKADSPVLKLVALDTIRVRASLPQRYYQHLAQNAGIRISFDALPEKSYRGKLSSLMSVGNQSTRSFPLFINIDNPKRTIAPGMSAQVFVELRSNTAKALLVPRDAVVLRADGSRLVWRVIEGKEGQHTVQAVKVLLGRAEQELLEVLDSSLQEGDRIVMLGNESLRPGQGIRINQANKE